MFSNYMLNKTSLQAKNIGFAICSTCTHIALTVGVLGGVQFGLLLPMDPTAHRCVWYWVRDATFPRKQHLQVDGVDTIML